MNARRMSTIEATRWFVETFETDYETARDYLPNKASITQDELDDAANEFACSRYCGQNDC